MEAPLNLQVSSQFISVLKLWDIDLKRTRPDINIAGSPERSDFRIVVESDRGERYILESISDRVYGHKKSIAAYLDALAGQGTEMILPYLKNAGGEHLIRHEDKWWQIQPFVEGVALDRPAYVFEGWRGDVMADFLLDFHRRAARCDFSGDRTVFSLPSYVRGIIGDMREHDPAHLFRVEGAVRFLNEGFMDDYDGLPVGFCHGDYHPLNIIWSDDGIKAVVDWEFCGWKPELYDAANMVGCLGMEHPQSLDSECVLNFLARLQESGLYQALSWQYFLELIVANRFGWMAEWLRKKDQEMIEMEGDYLAILLQQKNYFKDIWRVNP